MKNVREAIKNVFAAYDVDNFDYVKFIIIMIKLECIKLATASLLLSCFDLVKISFFSDELYCCLY